MKKLKVSKLEDLCGKYVNKFINFQWDNDNNRLNVYYANCFVGNYRELSVLLLDYGEYLELDKRTTLGIKEAISYIYDNYKPKDKTITEVDYVCEKIKGEFVNYFRIKTEEADGIYFKEFWTNLQLSELEIKI